MTDIFTKLAAPPPEKVHWRVGSTTKDKSRGLALCYIDARDVMQRLDDVVGPDNWSDAYEFHGPRILCRLSLRESASNEWITKSDGAGDTEVESEKGGLSDAFKRAAVKWGVGRYLYTIKGPWVLIEPAGKSWKIVQAETQKLLSILPGSVVETAQEAKPEQPQSPVQPQRSEPDLSDNQWEVVMGAKIDLQAALDEGGADHMAIIFTENAKTWEEHAGPVAMAEIRRIAKELSYGASK